MHDPIVMYLHLRAVSAYAQSHSEQTISSDLCTSQPLSDLEFLWNI